jgi:hypothetical protein
MDRLNMKNMTCIINILCDLLTSFYHHNLLKINEEIKKKFASFGRCVIRDDIFVDQTSVS